MNEKITFHQLGNKLSELTGGTQTTSELFVKEFFATVIEALQRDGIVKINNFGTFIISDTDGEKKVKFAPDKDIAEAINMPFSCFEAVELNDEVTDEILNVQEQDESLPENPFGSVAIESETSEAGQPITDDDLWTTNAESDCCTTAENVDTPLSSAGNEDNTPDETHTSTLKDEDTEIYKPECEPDDCQKEVSGKYSWTISVLCLIAGLVAGYLFYPIINQCNAPADKTTDTVIADTIEIFSSDMPAKSTEDSTKIATTPDSVNIIKPAVYDTIGKNRFLTTMSREYYGRMEFWVYIYEENKANLGNPNRIKPGTAIIIPPADKYGIDKNNPDCIDKAKLKAMEIYAPYEK